MLGFVFFFFFNTGVWSAVTGLEVWSFVGLVTFLLILGAGFLSSSRQFALEPLARFDEDSDVREALAGTPFPALADTVPTPVVCPLNRRQTANLRFVSVLSRLVMAMVLALAVFAIFVVLGFIVFGPDAVQGWAKQTPQVIFSLRIGDQLHIICWQQLKVAGFLATFSAFNYTLVAATDSRLRQEVVDTATTILRQACALRLGLLHRADHAPTTAQQPTDPQTPTLPELDPPGPAAPAPPEQPVRG